MPWRDGERLTYEVYWAGIIAAEGTFSARPQKEVWQFSLDLKSRGIVESIAKIRSKAISTVSVAPWTSLQFAADRREGAREYKYSCELGAGWRNGKYVDHLQPETKNIALPGPAVEDFISMVYRLRWQDWDKQKTVDFIVSDRWHIYQGRARLLKMEKIKSANGEERNCYLIEAKEVEQGKVIDKYYLRLWIPADNTRAPLMAKLKFKYGTVTIQPKQG